MQTQYFENLLREEFGRRAARNPQYSLRSYAKSLGVNHSVLSLVLSGKRSASKKLINIIMTQLPSDAAGDASGDYKDISEEQHQIIADWVHYAILSLVELPDFKPNPRWIGERLGISSVKARFSWNLLVENGLVAKVGSRWQQTIPPIGLNNKKPMRPATNLVRQFVEKASESFDNVPFEKRSLNNVTFAMNDEDVDYADEKLRMFWRRLTKNLAQRKKPNSVYALNVNLFPITQKNSSKEKLQ